MPASRIATISSEVATGRRMNGRDGFIADRRRSLRVRAAAGARQPPPLLPRLAVLAAALAGARRRSGRARRRLLRARVRVARRSARPSRLRAACRRRRRRPGRPGATPLSIGGRSRPATGPSFTGVHRDRLVVLDDVDERAGRAALDRRRSARASRRVSVSTSMRTLTNWFGNSALSSLANSALQLDRAGRRCRSGCRRSAACRSRASILPSRSQASTATASPLCMRLHHARHVVLGNREDDGDRLQLRDHDEAVGVGRVHDVARIDLAQSDAAADRRGDARVGELQLGVVDRALVGLAPCPRTGAPALPACRPAASRSNPARAASGSARGRPARS